MANADKHKVAEFNGPSYEHDSNTGLSKFYLITPTGNGNSIEILTGLLNEMPEFSISVNYENGPGAEWQDRLMSFMTSDLMQVASMIGSANGSFRNLLKMGSWTKKVYAGYKPSSINLNFRIYASDTLGQSPAERWINALNNYATLSSDNEFSLESAFENIGYALANMNATGNELGQILVKNIVSTNSETKEKDNLTDFNNSSDNVAKQVSKFNRTFPSAVANYLNYNPGSDLKGLTAYITSDPDDNGSTAAVTGLILKCSYRIRTSTYSSTAKLDATWKNVLASNETLNAASSSDIKDIKEDDLFKIIAGMGVNQEYVNSIKNYYERLSDKNELDTGPITDPKMQALYDTLNKIGSIADDAGKVIVGKYDNQRVFRRFNKENGLGEKLWYLVLYPDAIFSRENPLIVYISDWEAKYSEEAGPGGKPLYCDFKITCCLDQIYSRAQWYRVLAPGVKNLNKKELSPFERIDKMDANESN